jgi:hypothetical protein
MVEREHWNRLILDQDHTHRGIFRWAILSLLYLDKLLAAFPHHKGS